MVEEVLVPVLHDDSVGSVELEVGFELLVEDGDVDGDEEDGFVEAGVDEGDDLAMEEEQGVEEELALGFLGEVIGDNV